MNFHSKLTIRGKNTDNNLMTYPHFYRIISPTIKKCISNGNYKLVHETSHHCRESFTREVREQIYKFISVKNIHEFLYKDSNLTGIIEISPLNLNYNVIPNSLSNLFRDIIPGAGIVAQFKNGEIVFDISKYPFSSIYLDRAKLSTILWLDRDEVNLKGGLNHVIDEFKYEIKKGWKQALPLYVRQFTFFTALYIWGICNKKISYPGIYSVKGNSINGPGKVISKLLKDNSNGTKENFYIRLMKKFVEEYEIPLEYLDFPIFGTSPTDETLKYFLENKLFINSRGY